MVESYKKRDMEYDALVGKPRRKLRVNDIITDGASTTAIAGASTNADYILYQETVPAGFEEYPYVWYVAQNAPNLYLWSLVMNNSTQATVLSTGTTSSFMINQPQDSPITKLESTAVMSIVLQNLLTTGTFTTFVVKRREPSFANVETDV